MGEAKRRSQIIVDHVITPQGQLGVQGLIKSLNLFPNTVLIVKTDGDPTPIIAALQQIGSRIPFDVPIIVLKRDEELVQATKKDLEEALEIMARRDNGS